MIVTGDGRIYVTGFFDIHTDFDPTPETFALDNPTNRSMFVAKYEQGYLTVPESEQFDVFTVYPNPTISVQTLRIIGTDTQYGLIQLIDINGNVAKMIYDGPVANGETIYKVDIETLPSGIYIYQITFENGAVLHQKILKI